MKKRVFALLLTLVMVVGLFPTGAFATENRAETVVETLADGEKVTAADVTALIDKIPDRENVTEADAAAVEAARTALDSLDWIESYDVKNKDRLYAAESRLVELGIDKLPAPEKIQLSDGAAVHELYEKNDNLDWDHEISEEHQAKLDACLERLTVLETEVAQPVIDLINALADKKVTEESKDAVKAEVESIEAEYAKLDKGPQSQVSNYHYLKAIRAQLAALDEMPASVEVTVVASHGKDSKFLFMPQKVTAYDTLAEQYGYFGIREPESPAPSMFDALVAAHKQVYGDAFTVKTAINYLRVEEYGDVTRAFGVDFEDIPNSYLDPSMCLLNGTTPWGGSVRLCPADGDLVELIRSADMYASFNSKAYEVWKNLPLTMTLNTVAAETLSNDRENAKSTPMIGTEYTKVHLVDQETGMIGEALEGVSVTEKGELTMTFAEPGVYMVAVDGMSFDNLPHRGCDEEISPAWTCVTVKAPTVELVNETVAAIGEVTLEDEKLIGEARIYFDGLTAEQKAEASEAEKTLVAAEARLAEVKSEAAVQIVEEAIDAIGQVELESADKIAKARGLYELLTEAEQAEVKNLDVLEAAEAELARLQADKAEADKAAAQVVDAKIAAIGKVTLSSAEAVEAARAAFDALTLDQKELVTEFDTLLNAEKTLKQLQESSHVDAYWPSFRGSDTNMAIVDAKTPASAAGAELKWFKQMGRNYGSGSPGPQLIVDNSLVMVAGKKLFKLDLQTGEELASVDMAGGSAFAYTAPAAGDGMIFVPLNGGKVQAFDAKTLTPLWLYQDPLGGQDQVPVAYSNGYVITGFWNRETEEASMVCLSAADEDPEKTDEKKEAVWTKTALGGYYWAGPVVVNDVVVFGTDDGEAGSVGHGAHLYSVNVRTGEIISDLTGLTGDQRSSIAYSAEYGRVYFTTKGGYLYSAAINANSGVMGDLKKLRIGNQSTCTPVVYGKHVYVTAGGGVGDSQHANTFNVVDAEHLELVYCVGLDSYAQSSPVLSTAYEQAEGRLYFYFTCYSTPGGITLLTLDPRSDDPAQAVVEELYDAKDHEQYCISSIVCGPDGTLYYKNDSAAVFAVGSRSDAQAKVNVSMEQDNFYPVVPQDITVCESLSDKYGYQDQVIGAPSALDSLIAAHEILFGEAYTPETKDEFLAVDGNGFITTMMGEVTGNVGFAINGEMPNDGVINEAYGTYTGYSLNQAALKNGDVVQFFFYNPDGYYGEIYTNFVNGDKHITELKLTEGQEQLLKVQGYSFVYEGCNPEIKWKDVSGIQVCTLNMTGENAGTLTPLTNAVTNDDGQFTLKLDKAGTYYLAVTSDPENLTYILPQICKVTVEKKSSGGGGAGGGGSHSTAMDVSFKLVGSTKASADIDMEVSPDMHGAEYVTWIENDTYTLDEGATVYDLFTKALKKAGLKSVGAEENYVRTIYAPADQGGYALSEFTNGSYSGWMYTVNGTHVGEGLKKWTLHDGDTVVWHYVNDYRYEAKDWESGAGGGGQKPGQAMNFTDVKKSDWCYDAVKYVFEKGMMNGTTATTFSPNRPITRGQIAAILWRLAGSPKAKQAAGFTDVAADAYYARAIDWAVEKGVVNGYADKTFKPDMAISRQQLAAMLYRYAGSPAVKSDLNDFSDAASVSDYAVDAMSWAVSQGIINGTAQGTLNPQGTAIRAHAAAMLMRFCEKTGK